MVSRVLKFIALMSVFTFVFAQDVSITDPAAWFMSSDALFAAATMITPWIVKIFTAFFKKQFNTHGWTTVAISGVVAVLLAGIGGGLGLGMFTGLSGFEGVWRAVLMVAVGWIGSNASHTYDVQLKEKEAKILEESRLKLK